MSTLIQDGGGGCLIDKFNQFERFYALFPSFKMVNDIRASLNVGAHPTTITGGLICKYIYTHNLALVVMIVVYVKAGHCQPF